ncbi:DMT family transporter [Paenalcaligenes niemegkensis]|uniref:DMT family transporter n=1 Tax=Paenalcaligenes niemegkensis TaxID=2895469 RepID=UPI001EE88B3A|nr:DMT family transporter [Paenalcaligenes niemegkensis]MCQ9617624.1 DMT family transporter [Paenalcaligenes niemegkensis]
MPLKSHPPGGHPSSAPAATGKALGNPVYGILILILSSWALSTLDAGGKWVMGVGVPLLFLCWVRYVVHLALVLALVLPGKGFGIFKTKRPKAQMLRGMVMLLATFSFFTALSYLPQAEATAINFLAPLIVLSIAPWLLKEAPRVSRWVAAAIGFLGVIVIIRPGAGLDPVGVAFGLITASMFAIQFITTRQVAIDNSLTTLVWSGLMGTIITSVLLPFNLDVILPIAKQLSAFEWLILCSTGFWGCLGHLLQIQAYQRAAASMLAPFAYLQIVSAAALGWLVWGHFPDALTWVGIAIVCGSGIVIGFIEWQRQTRTLSA